MYKIPQLISCVVAVLALVIASSAVAQTATKKIGWIEPVEREIEGWTVSVDPALISGDQKELGTRALAMLRNHLERMVILLPEKQLEEMRQFGIWLEYHHPELDNMQYHPEKEWLVERGYHPDLAKKVHLPRAESLLSREQMLKQPAVIIHELAHAYHDQVLGFDHPEILAAFEAAKKKGNYEEVQLVDGRKMKHYALTDHKEYFAEATEAYLYRNDHFPFVAAELKDHDSALYDLMDKIWQSRAKLSSE